MQDDLFNTKSVANNWETEWLDMPECINENEPDPEIIATFKFRNQKDFEDFKAKAKEHIYNGEKLFDGNQRKDKKQAWYPLREKPSKYNWVSENPLQPRFPIYIVSKGRFKNNPTSKALLDMGVPFFIICEEHEYDDYCYLVGRKRVLILPQKYKDEYDTFWDDDDPRTGPGPARNFAWDNAIESGYDWHWVMDDNILSFQRYHENMKRRCSDGTYFRACEDFVLRYDNVGQAGLNYTTFVEQSKNNPSIIINSRIYSCLLIRNDTPFRWRGRYNEDTDLSLNMMKAGWCTIQFNFFLQEKVTTQKLRGGNSKEFYDKEGTKKKSQMLEDMHPDVAKVVWRFNRWHHHVDYSTFKKRNILKRKPEVQLTKMPSNYHMKKVLN